MTPILSQIKILGRAAFVAVVLGAAAFAAAPAIAQDEPPAGFTLQVPKGDQQQFQTQQQGQSGDLRQQGHFDPNTDDFYYCMDDGETRAALRAYGFERVRITRHLRNNRVEVTAWWGRSQYSMRVDQCTGEVDRVRRIRRGGFGLQFNFNN